MAKTERPNRPALTLHVPEPEARPGDAVDFGRIAVPGAGSAPRPDVAVAATETHPLCYTLVRVLDDEGRAIGPWDPKLDAEKLRRILRDMLLVRVFDERMFRASGRARPAST